MSRTRAVAVVLGVCAVGTAVAVRRWPDERPALDCTPSEVRLDEAGVARCGPGGVLLPAGQALTVGQRLSLEAVTAAELALIPGISEALAQRLVEERERRGGFRSWDEVDLVEGVGAVRLGRLQQYCQLQSTDGGV